MKFYDWYKNNSREELEALAEAAGNSADYLSLVARGHRKASHELAKLIEEHIDGVTRHDLRPDIFGESEEQSAA